MSFKCNKGAKVEKLCLSLLDTYELADQPMAAPDICIILITIVEPCSMSTHWRG